MKGNICQKRRTAQRPSQEKRPRSEETLRRGSGRRHISIKGKYGQHALILFVSLPDDDGRRPMYWASAQPSSSDCSSFSASGEDDIM